jgi:anaerobic magnesium-protoporphyrin IX monomethyl ester cyclase
VLTETLRAAVRSFIKRTNLDTHECLCRIYDFVAAADPHDQVAIRSFAREMREHVDQRSQSLHVQGERILGWLDQAFEKRGDPAQQRPALTSAGLPSLGCRALPYRGIEGMQGIDLFNGANGLAGGPIPYHVYQRALAEQRETAGCQ